MKTEKAYWSFIIKSLEDNRSNNFSRFTLYLRYAMEYFIVARRAYFKNFDISGNLFHHAIEMALKSFLRLHISEAHLASSDKFWT